VLDVPPDIKFDVSEPSEVYEDACYSFYSLVDALPEDVSAAVGRLGADGCI